MVIPLESPITEKTLTTVKLARLTHTALHEATHCVIACDVGYQVTWVKLDRKNFGGWMQNSQEGDDLVKDAKISLAGVAFEGMVWNNRKLADIWCGGDLKQAYKSLQKDESVSWVNPTLRSHDETVTLLKRELYHVETRLIKLWPVVECVAARILKNKLPVFPRSPTSWSNKVRRCINNQAYLKQQAPWANSDPPIEWLQRLGSARHISSYTKTVP